MGELYLSPVGLSMLTSFFGNFLAGMAGEYYDKYEPVHYFLALMMILMVVALAGFAIGQKLTKTQ